jgi:phage terminase large subunit-like protein
MCEHVIRQIDPTIRVKKVHASRGKHVRFEPLGARYERGEEHHVGTFPELEDEICAFTPDGYDGDDSPNRADAAVWADAELFPVTGRQTAEEALAAWGGVSEARA